MVEVINEIKVTKSESVGEYLHDVWLAQTLRNDLLFDSRVRSINYNVDCVAGTIYLMGVAQNQAELQRVIDHARDISYVRNVISFVRLKNDPARQQTSIPPARRRDPMKPAEGADRAAAVARLSAFGAADDSDIDLAEAALLLGSFERPEADLDAPGAGLARSCAIWLAKASAPGRSAAPASPAARRCWPACWPGGTS